MYYMENIGLKDWKQGVSVLKFPVRNLQIILHLTWGRV